MRAAIDIGSNSIRLAMSDGTKRSAITKLADGLAQTGALSPCGVEATITTLKEYAGLCAKCDSVVPFATEAVRRATDGSAFVDRVKRETGLIVKVVPPETEARLALFGAKRSGSAVTVCDLGGGSMELISAADGITPEYAKSLQLGVVVLKNRYRGDYRAAIDEAPALVAEYGATKKYPLVVMGGSACCIAAGAMNMQYYDVKKVDGYVMTAAELDDFLPVLMSGKLATLRPVCAKRADTIAYGAIIIQALLGHMGLNEFTVSDSGNLEAVLNGFEL